MNKDIHELYSTLDRIIGWVENCDTKASVLTALVGVFISVLFTSSFITDSLRKIVSPILFYWKTGSGYFCLFSTLKLMIFIGMAICFLFALSYLLKTLSAKTSSKQTIDNNVNSDSLIHYGSIQTKFFNEFKSNILAETEEDKFDDILSQIYINSKRCQEKFNDYNKSIIYIRVGVGLFILYTVLVIL